MEDVLDSVYDDRLRLPNHVEDPLQAQDPVAVLFQKPLDPANEPEYLDWRLGAQAQGANAVIVVSRMVIVTAVCERGLAQPAAHIRMPVPAWRKGDLR